MTIGFLSSQLSFLEEYKNTITAYPQFSYVFYADTLHASYRALSAEQLSSVLENACSFLLKKEVSVVVVNTDVDTDAVMQELSKLGAKEVRVIHLDELSLYVTASPHTSVEEIGSQTRIVHLTQHNESNDEAIAEILGGFYIEE